MNDNKKKQFIIYAPSYDENYGGCIVQHKLCSILNNLGYEAYIHPFFTRYFELEKSNYQLSIKALISFIWQTTKCLYEDFREYKKFKINPEFNTPLFKQKNITFDDNWVVIYPEITFGNPLKAKNVVRWLLHQPGFHTGRIFYGPDELIVKFSTAINDFEYFGSSTANSELKIIHYPLKYYNLQNVSKTRKGTAYTLRKKKNKQLQHDLNDSVLIDGKSHEEISEIFKQVKTFISYDSYTAYSIFAVLCGCDSVVIPDEGVDMESWYPDPKDRQGIAYGFENIEYARTTSHLVKEHVVKEEEKSIDNVKKFIQDVNKYFE